jgi:hypothetical protein
MNASSSVANNFELVIYYKLAYPFKTSHKKTAFVFTKAVV